MIENVGKNGKKRELNLGLGLGSLLNDPQQVQGRYIYHQGNLYRRTNKGKISLINYTLPEIDWYDLVTIVTNPSNQNELWMALGPHGLYYSRNGGKTFEVLESVNMAERIEITATEDSTALILNGRLSTNDGKKGRFISIDGGCNWREFNDSDEQGDECPASPIM